jgi:hypothetical protein
MTKSIQNYSLKRVAFLVLITYSFICNAQVKYNVGLIGFYNLENLYDTIDQDQVSDEEFTPNGTRRYTGATYIDKLSKLEQVLSEMGTDHRPEGIALLGVAEIENRSVLKDLCAQPKLKDRNYKIVHYDSKDARGIDVALLYNPAYFKVISSEKIYVDMSDLGEGKTRDILYVKGIFMGEELHVMVAHWPSRRGGEEVSLAKRCRAAQFMRKKADSVYALNPNANIIAMGDLNDDPTSPSLTDCLKAAGKKEQAVNGIFFNPFYDYFKKGIGTLAYNDSWNLFDQIVVSSSMLTPDNGLKFSGGHIFKRPYMTQMDGQYKGYPFRTYNGDIYQGGYSDHFPTYLVVKKKVGN